MSCGCASGELVVWSASQTPNNTKNSKQHKQKMARVNKSIFLLFENNLLIIIIQIISATEGGCNKGRKV